MGLHAHPARAFLCLPPLCALPCCCGEGMLLIAEETENSCSFHATLPTRFIPCRRGLLLLMNMHPCSPPSLRNGCGGGLRGLAPCHCRRLCKTLEQQSYSQWFGFPPSPPRFFLLYFSLLRTKLNAKDNYTHIGFPTIGFMVRHPSQPSKMRVRC